MYTFLAKKQPNNRTSNYHIFDMARWFSQTTRLNNSFSASNHTEFEYLCRAVFLDPGSSHHDILYLLDIQKSFSDVGGNVRSAALLLFWLWDNVCQTWDPFVLNLTSLCIYGHYDCNYN